MKMMKKNKKRKLSCSRNITVLETELYIIVPREDKDFPLKAEHILLTPHVSHSRSRSPFQSRERVYLDLKVKFILGVEQAMGMAAANCSLGARVIPDQGAGVTHFPSVELDFPDLAECLAQ